MQSIQTCLAQLRQQLHALVMLFLKNQVGGGGGGWLAAACGVPCPLLATAVAGKANCHFQLHPIASYCHYPLPLSQDTREAMLGWLAAALNSNLERAKMRPDPRKSATDGFVLNLAAVRLGVGVCGGVLWGVGCGGSGAVVLCPAATAAQRHEQRAYLLPACPACRCCCDCASPLSILSAARPGASWTHGEWQGALGWAARGGFPAPLQLRWWFAFVRSLCSSACCLLHCLLNVLHFPLLPTLPAAMCATLPPA